MLLSDIHHRLTLNAIKNHNIDVSQFENITDLRKHMRKLNFKKFHEINKDKFNEKIKQYYHEKRKLLNGMTGQELRNFKKKLEKLIVKHKDNMKLRQVL